MNPQCLFVTMGGLAEVSEYKNEYLSRSTELGETGRKEGHKKENRKITSRNREFLSCEQNTFRAYDKSGVSVFSSCPGGIPELL